MRSLIVLTAVFATASAGLGLNNILTQVVSPNLLNSIVDPSLLSNLQSGTPQNLIITLHGVDEALGSVVNQVFTTRSERINAVVNALKLKSTITQAPILGALKSLKLTNPNLDYKSYYASNQITVANADLSLIAALLGSLPIANLIASIRKQVYIGIAPLQNVTAPVLGPVLAWGVNKIGAKTLWAQGIDGTGVTIGSIDTGVRVTHDALAGSYLNGPYAWYDPSGISTGEPTDVVGHGSHTTGIMAGTGSSQIGVAPGAKWMACRGCLEASCPVDNLLSCMQFMLCPFANGNPNATDCSKAPRVINNSWGGGQAGDTTFRNMIKAWNASGIVGVFAIGNSGPFCNTTGSPGDDDSSMLISVGGTDITGGLGYFSSKGPSYYGKIKPEISAPGETIYSAWNATDNTYVPLDGTSMATPHVTGVIALMLQKNPNLTLPQIQANLYAGATQGNVGGFGALPTPSCGGVAVSSSFNNQFGHGIVNAVNSVK